jgi:hypothetical protein
MSRPTAAKAEGRGRRLARAPSPKSGVRALDDRQLALQIRTVVVSHAAALRRMALVPDAEREDWIADAHLRAVDLIGRIEQRAGASISDGQRAALADGRAKLEVATQAARRALGGGKD